MIGWWAGQSVIQPVSLCVLTCQCHSFNMSVVQSVSLYVCPPVSQSIITHLTSDFFFLLCVHVFLLQIKCVFIDVFFFVAVYKFFEQRNVRLRGNPDFAPGIKFVFIFVKSIFCLSLVVSMVVKFMSVLQECILYKLKVIPPLSCCILIHKNVTLSLPLVYM